MNNIKEKMSAVLNGIGIVTVLLLLCTIFAIKAPGFVSVRNLYYILQQVSVVGILVIGQTLVIITKGIDLSQDANQ